MIPGCTVPSPWPLQQHVLLDLGSQFQILRRGEKFDWAIHLYSRCCCCCWWLVVSMLLFVLFLFPLFFGFLLLVLLLRAAMPALMWPTPFGRRRVVASCRGLVIVLFHHSHRLGGQWSFETYSTVIIVAVVVLVIAVVEVVVRRWGRFRLLTVVAFLHGGITTRSLLCGAGIGGYRFVWSALCKCLLGSLRLRRVEPENSRTQTSGCTKWHWLLRLSKQSNHASINRKPEKRKKGCINKTTCVVTWLYIKKFSALCYFLSSIRRWR